MTGIEPSPGSQPDLETPPRRRHVCPVWIAYLLLSPLRKLGEHPEKLLAPFVTPGMTVVDLGCAMGYFSLPLARMVGDHGRVVCVDIQQRMLSTLVRRARRRGLDRVIETRLCTQASLGLEDLAGQAGVVLAAHVVHEAEHPRRFLASCQTALKPGGRLLVLEPDGHVSPEEFDATRRLALECGLVEQQTKQLAKSRLMVLTRPPR
jgi:2-polyprenyl-3-methyl-5-hydroxy-6-metoxy-1,4-benzoquinol methylase